MGLGRAASGYRSGDNQNLQGSWPLLRCGSTALLLYCSHWSWFILSSEQNPVHRQPFIYSNTASNSRFPEPSLKLIVSLQALLSIVELFDFLFALTSRAPLVHSTPLIWLHVSLDWQVQRAEYLYRTRWISLLLLWPWFACFFHNNITLLAPLNMQFTK